jgi:hemolysin D
MPICGTNSMERAKVMVWRKLISALRARMRDRHTQQAMIAQLPDALELEMRALPIPVHSASYALLALLGAAMVWAALARVERVVVATGRLVTRQQLTVIQPLESAIIRELMVREGSPVRAGQIIARLDPTFTSADQSGYGQRLASIDAQIARLQAEQGARGQGPSTTVESAMLVQRRAQYAARLAEFDAKIAGLRSQIAGAKSQITGIDQRLVGLRTVQSMREELAVNGYSSKVQVLQAADAVLSLQGQRRETETQTAALTHKLGEALGERAGYVSQWHADSSAQLEDALRQRDAVASELAKAQRKSDLTVIRAPVDGIVMNVARRSVGSVLQPAEPFLTIVPANAQIQAEVMVDAADVSLVHPGLLVVVKLEAYPFQKYGTLSGQLKIISPDAQQDKDVNQGRPHYLAIVSIPANRLSQLPRPVALRPGMSATAEIMVGQRSVLAYLLNPVLRIWDEALREPQ